MKALFDQAYKLTDAHEGGYVNHPKDPGGPTDHGVTQRVYDAYRRTRGLPIRPVATIADAEVQEIYHGFWSQAGCDNLPAGLDYAVFDYAINSGVSQAVKDLQRVLKVPVDGINGERTKEAAIEACAYDEDEVLIRYCAQRMAFLKRQRTWGTFGKGWTRRVEGDYQGPNDGDHGVLDYAVMLAHRNNAIPIRALPTAIGQKPDEAAAKSPPSNTAVTKTAGGAGSVAAGIGVSGQTLITAAQQVQPNIDQTPLGKALAVLFAALMVVGVAMLIWDFWKKQHAH